MKVIEPIKIWNGGAVKEAIYFDLLCKFDDLADSATFYYYLYDVKMTLLASVGGNEPPLVMTGSIYNNWTDNDYAYDWAADKLGITILGPYTTTTTTTNTSRTTTTTSTSSSTTTTTTTEIPVSTTTTTTTEVIEPTTTSTSTTNL